MMNRLARGQRLRLIIDDGLHLLTGLCDSHDRLRSRNLNNIVVNSVIPFLNFDLRMIIASLGIVARCTLHHERERHSPLIFSNWREFLLMGCSFDR